MRDLDYICQGWYADCNIEWEAVGAFSTTAALIFAGIAILVASSQAKTARDAERRSAKEAEEKQKRDGAALAAAINSELRGVLSELNTLAKWNEPDTLVSNHWVQYRRDALELPVLRGSLHSLGCFDAEIGFSLGTSLARISAVRAAIPKFVNVDAVGRASDFITSEVMARANGALDAALDAVDRLHPYTYRQQ